MYSRIILILGCIIQIQSALGLWTCTQDLDCSSLSGSVCVNGDCMCPTGQQSVFGGTRCVDLAPYHTSECVEEHQCSRLFSSFECRVGNATESQVGNCACQSGHHYFLGRCWPTINYGASCNRDEECLGALRDPYNLQCSGTCQCADGFYERQRGECRRIGHAVGDGCVLNEDCQFPGGACDIFTFSCVLSTTVAASESKTLKVAVPNNISLASAPKQVAVSSDISLASAPRQVAVPSDISLASAPKQVAVSSNISLASATRQHGVACSMLNPCAAPYECSVFGACVCPIGYYNNDEGTRCLAELGSPATDPEQCVGLLATIINGICTCPANFYFEENMRDCIKVSRRITDSCVTDSNCHTFGSAARCGEPQQWGLRNCECIPELAVWEASREMCRLFAGIGEACEVDSDCLAGELEIQCIHNDEGEGVCTCPEGFVASDGLCLTTGLEIGDPCQASVECTETPNTVCYNGVCACDSNSYQEIDGFCAPIIGGVCIIDEDCVIENTVCTNSSDVLTCQCDDQFVEQDDVCWPVVPGINASCEVNAQCEQALGEASTCHDGHCLCIDYHHHRDGSCWPMTGLFEECNRISQCYLHGISERVVCRNSLCQCDFDFPFSEELNTCTGAATTIFGSVLLTTIALFYHTVS